MAVTTAIPVPQDEQAQQETQSKSFAAKGVLFDETNSTMVSNSFRVSDDPVRIVAFGLMPEDKLIVHRVLLSSSGLNMGICATRKSPSQERTKVHTVGGVEVSPTGRCEILIDATGDFRLEYVGDDRESLYVIYTKEPVTTGIDNKMRGIE
jgi:hypothetical protein